MSNDINIKASDTIETYEARKRIVNEINEKFKIERYLYLIVSILCFAIVVYLAFDLYRLEKIGTDQLALFLGPTGFLVLAISRILYMWSKSMKIIFTGKM